MRCVRVWFNKTGLSRFISHLDLMRAMTRAVRRSEIPLWYTEGFNPRPYMTFSLPLSLGMESFCESMDIRVEGDITNEEVYNKLKPVMPPSIEITGVTDPKHDPKLITSGEFEVNFSYMKDKSAFEALIEKMLTGNEIIVQKLSKKGKRKVMKDIDLLPYVKKWQTQQTDEGVKFELTLPAGSTTNINPELLCKEIVKISEEDVGYVIVRKALLMENGEKFA